MRSTVFDLGYLEAGAEVFKTFLTSKSLFFPLNTPPPLGEKAYPRLTLGGVLLSITRLQARELSVNQAVKFRTLCNAVADWRTSRWVLWERKAQRELISRMRQWELYLLESRKNPGRHLDFYLNEVHVRVMIELLALEIEPLDAKILENLEAMDCELRSFFYRGAFIWEDQLSSSFPSETFWYLWGKPVLEEDFD